MSFIKNQEIKASFSIVQPKHGNRMVDTFNNNYIDCNCYKTFASMILIDILSYVYVIVKDVP